jgi:hypothetical protein
LVLGCCDRNAYERAESQRTRTRSNTENDVGN